MKTSRVSNDTGRRMLALVLCGILASGATGGTFAASPPAAINYQGVLRDAAGAPEDGNFDMIFRFFDASAGGNELLVNTHDSGDSVAVVDGLFNVRIGDGVLAPGAGTGAVSALPDLFRDHGTVWMQIEIDDGGAFEVLSPRVRLVSAAYALNADHIDGKDGSELLDTSATAQSKTGLLTLQDLTVQGTLSGSGASLTNLQAGNLTGTVPGAALSGAYGNALTLSNAGNTITGTFTGDGSGLTGLDATTLTGTLPDASLSGTYGSALTLSNAGNAVTGTFTGDGSGLTGLDATTLIGTLPDVSLSGTYGSALTLSNPSNAISGTFTGDGSGLTGIIASNADTLDGIDSTEFAQVGQSNIFSTTQTVQSGNKNAMGLIVQGANNQMDNLQEWQDDLGTPVALMSADGDLTVSTVSGDGSGLTALDAASLTGTLPDVSLTGTYTSALTFSNPSNSFAGSFSGDGSGLTGIVTANADTLDGIDSTAFAQVGQPNTFSAGTQTVQTGAAGTTGLVVQGAASQTATLQEWQDDGGTPVADMSAAGDLTVNSVNGDGSGLTALDATALTGTLPDASLGGTYGNALTLSNASNAITGSFSGDGSGLANVTATSASDSDTLDGIDSTAFAQVGQPNTFSAGTQTVQTGAAGTTGLVVQGAASQTATLQEWQDDLGTPVADMSAAGDLTVNSVSGDGSGLTALDATTLTGTLPSVSLSGTYSNALTLNNASNVFAGSFSGDGSGLTGIIASNADTLDGLDSTAFARLGQSNTFSTGTQTFLTGASGIRGVVIQGAVGQSVPLQEWRNDAGAAVANINALGDLTVNSISGNGSGLTSLGAASITTGTLGELRLAGTYSRQLNLSHPLNIIRAASFQGGSFSGGSVTASSFSGNGSGLSSLSAANLTGTVPDASISGTYGNALTLSNASNSITGTFTGDGSALTGIVASDADTLDGIDSTAFAQVGQSNTFSAGTQTVQTGAPANTGLIVQGAASQTATLQEWQDDAATPVADMSAAGDLTVNSVSGDGSGLTALDATALTGTLPDASLSGTYGSALTLSNGSNAITGSFSGDGSGLANVTATSASDSDTLDGIDSTAFAQVGQSNTFSAGTQTVQTGAPATTGLIVQGAASQTATLQEWQNDAATAVADMSAAGDLTVNSVSGDGSGLTALDATTLTGTLPDASLSGTYGSALTLSNASNAITGSFSGDGSGLANVTATSASDSDTLDGIDSTAFAQVGQSNTFSAGTQTVQTGAPANTGLIVQGAASQTATLQEWQNDAATAVADMSAAGDLTVNSVSGDGSGLTALDATTLTGTLPDASLSGTYGSALTLSNGSNAITGSFSGDGSGLTGVTASNADTLDSLDSTAFAQVGQSNTFSAGTQTVQTGAPATTGLIVQGAASQTATLQEWQNDAATAVADMSAAGDLTVNSVSGDGSGLTALDATALTGTLPDASLSGTYGSALTLSNASNAITGSFSGDGSGLANVTATSASDSDTLDGLDSTAFAQVGQSNTFSAGTQTVQTGAPATTGLIVQGAASQTATLQEWQNDAATAVADMSAAGDLTVNSVSGDGSGLTALDADNVSAGRLALDRFTDDDATADLCLVSGGAGGEPNYKVCPGGGGIAAVVDDTTPALGGSLDVAGFEITSSSNGNVVINPNGTGQITLGANTTLSGTLNMTGTLATLNTSTVAALTSRLDITAGDADFDDLYLSAGNSFDDGSLRIFGDSSFDMRSGNGLFRFFNGQNGSQVASISNSGSLTLSDDLSLDSIISFGTGASMTSTTGNTEVFAGSDNIADLLLNSGNSSDDGSVHIFGDGVMDLTAGSGAFNFIDGSTTTTVATLDGNGDLAIDGALDIGGGDITGGNINFNLTDGSDVILGDGTSTTPDVDLAIGAGSICVDSDGSCTPPANGQVSATAYNTGSSDVAEVYPSDDLLKAGDVIVLDPASDGKVRMTQQAYEAGLISVVSTKPGFVLGTPSDEKLAAAGLNPELHATFGNLTLLPQTFPVVMVGRVPVRVTDENGPVSTGDYLTSSSTPGAAMRATAAGSVLGQALQSWNGSGEGTVMALIMPRWQGGSASAPAAPAAAVQQAAPVVSSSPATGAPSMDGDGNVFAASFRPAAPEMATFLPVSAEVELGDVLVADRDLPGHLRPSWQEGDPAVVGVVSGDPGLLLGGGSSASRRAGGEIGTGDLSGSYGQPLEDLAAGQAAGEAPVAFSGIVLCKVDAGYGTIEVGDLLMTSPTPGHAMRADEARPGTLVGKALESMDAGSGLIRVLVMLR